MRKIIFLVILSFINESLTGDPVMQHTLTNNLNMVFYTREKCQKPSATEADKTKIKMIQFKTSTQYNEYCDDAIAFLPHPGNEVQIFISATKVKEETIQTLELHKEISKDNYEKVFSCGIDGKTDIEQKWTDVNSELGPLKQTSEILDLTSPISMDNILRCRSVKMGMDKVPGKWKLEKIFPTGTGSNVGLETEIDAATMKRLAENVRCDHSKLTFDETSVGAKEYKKIDLTQQSDSLKLLDVSVSQTGTAVYWGLGLINLPKGGDCNDPYSFVYKKNNDVEKDATEITCEKDPNNIYKYKVQRPDKSGGPPVPEFMEPEDDVKFLCMKNKCRQCKLNEEEQKKPCKGDTHCDPVQLNSNTDTDDATTCYFLDTAKCTSKIIFLNAKYQKFEDVKNTNCGNNETFTINGQTVKSIHCADKYSAELNGDELTQREEPTKLNVPVLSVNASDCKNSTHGCSCNNERNFKQLVIANKAGTDYLSVDSIIFNTETKEWNYNRTMSKDKIRSSSLMEYQAVRCISKSQKSSPPKDLHNPAKIVVFIVNFVLIAILLAAVIPGVIFYVNARVKKREALKAAKMDKKKKGGDDKKEEQSGEKKDEDKKNSEEKKNEA